MANSKNLIRVDYEKIYKRIEESPFNQQEVNLILGKNRSWLSVGKSRDYSLEKDDVERLASVLRCEMEDILEVPKLTPVIESAEQSTDVRPGTLDTKPLEKKIDALTEKVDKMIELLASLSSTQTVNPVKAQEDWNKKPRAERARLIVQDLVNDGDGKCLRTTYIKKLAEANIASSYADEAIKESGYEKGTTGYGSNTTTWILDPYWEKGDN